MILLTLVAVTAMQSVGTILIVAMLITPAATAFICKQFKNYDIYFGDSRSVLIIARFVHWL